MSQSARFQRDDHNHHIMLTQRFRRDTGYFNSSDHLLPRPTFESDPGEEKYMSDESKFTRFPTMEPWWGAISVMACVVAISLDPLFFYIPYIDNDKKCLGMDKDLRNVALVSRSFTDITFMVHIIYEIRTAIKTGESERGKPAKPYELGRKDPFVIKIRALIRNLSWGSFLTDILALLPIPQVLIISVFFNMGGPRYLEDRKAVCFFVLAQYLPRMYRIYLSSNKLRKRTAIWLKGAFNFFMYIIASHILGAFWYFFSIQRVTACWHQTYCKTSQGCSTTYYCDNIALIDISLINGSCPVSPPDPEKFDFGMFTDGLKSGNTGSISFSVKLFYTLWWGLRNLSNFGTSLVTSTYVWENLFAVLVSVVGLILFSYLIGNMQQCMQWEEKKKVESDKFKLIEKDLESWAKKNELDDAITEEVMETVKKKLEDDVDFDAANLENLFSILPWPTKKVVKRRLCMSMLRKVPVLSQKEDRELNVICDYMKPVNYPENTIVFHMREPIDRMIFIFEGSMWTYTTASEFQTATGRPSGSMDAHLLKKGDSYGDMLLQVASSSLMQLPVSVANVKCHTKVEAFVLMAQDLANLKSTYTYAYTYQQEPQSCVVM